MRTDDSYAQVCDWTGPKHPKDPKGQRAQMNLVIGNDGGKMTSKMTSVQATQMYLGTVGSQYTKFQPTAIQSGSIGGMEYARAYWTGTDKQTHKVFHGAVYATSSAPDLIQATLKDTQPFDKKSIPVLEASLQTFRKLSN